MNLISFIPFLEKKGYLSASVRHHSWQVDPEWFDGHPLESVAVMEFCTHCGCRVSSFPPAYNKSYMQRWIQGTAPMGKQQLECPETCEEAIKLVLGESFNFDIFKEYFKGF